MGDMALLLGPDYNPYVQPNGGDGSGVAYPFWDKSSVSLCHCDDNYFGADCSQGMI